MQKEERGKKHIAGTESEERKEKERKTE